MIIFEVFYLLPIILFQASASIREASKSSSSRKSYCWCEETEAAVAYSSKRIRFENGFAGQFSHKIGFGPRTSGFGKLTFLYFISRNDTIFSDKMFQGAAIAVGHSWSSASEESSPADRAAAISFAHWPNRFGTQGEATEDGIGLFDKYFCLTWQQERRNRLEMGTMRGWGSVLLGDGTSEGSWGNQRSLS